MFLCTRQYGERRSNFVGVIDLLAPEPVLLAMGQGVRLQACVKARATAAKRASRPPSPRISKGGSITVTLISVTATCHSRRRIDDCLGGVLAPRPGVSVGRAEERIWGLPTERAFGTA